MPWTCHACTYHHDRAEEEVYLACQICGTARRPKEDGTAVVNVGCDDEGKGEGGTFACCSSSAADTGRKATATCDATIDLTGSHSDDDEETHNVAAWDATMTTTTTTMSASNPSSIGCTRPHTDNNSNHYHYRQQDSSSHLPQRQLKLQQPLPIPSREAQTPKASLSAYLSSSMPSSSSSSMPPSSSGRIDNLQTIIQTVQPPCAFYAHKQTDRWSCGYRNLQNIIVYLCHVSSSLHLSSSFALYEQCKCALLEGALAVPITTPTTTSATTNGVNFNRDNYKRATTTTTTSTSFTHSAVSVLEIQRIIQKSWNDGYDDPTAGDNFSDDSIQKQETERRRRQRLVRSEQWIGTPECACALRYCRIPFNIQAWSDDENEDDRQSWPDNGDDGGAKMKCAADCMVHFVVNYFFCSVNGMNISNAAVTNSKNGYSFDSNGNDDGSFGWTGEKKKNVIPPLYLQWRGHSVTCVGVIMTRRRQHERQPLQLSSARALLISDPAFKNGQVVEKSIAQLKRIATAWEVGYVPCNLRRLLNYGEGKRIENYIPH